MPDIINDDDLSALAAEYVLGTLEPDERTRANVLLDVDHGFRGLVRVWERRLGELHLMVEPVEPDQKIWERIRTTVGAPPFPSMVPSERLEPSATQEPSEPAETPAKSAMPAAGGASTQEQMLAELMLEVEKFAEQRASEPPPAAPEAPEPTPAEPEREVEHARLAEKVAREPAPAVLLPAKTAPAKTVRPPREQRPPAARGLKVYALLATLIAFGLGGLIASWRFIPDRLPSLLNPVDFLRLVDAPVPPPKKSPPPTFDE